MKIVFAGTPDFAARHLEKLIAAGHEVVAVYSQPDRPAGRGKKLTASPVKTLALEHGIPVYQPASLKTAEAQQELAALQPDLMVVVAYGLILPKAALDVPRRGCWNVHGSLLPKWRGAAPIQRSIWAGDEETGVTIMQMDEGLDTGDMLLKRALPIHVTDTSATLYDKLAEIGPRALLDCLAQIDKLNPIPQSEANATHAAKLSKREALIDWSLPAAQLERNIRAFNPWPMAYFTVGETNIKVWQAAANSAQSVGQPGDILAADKSGIQVQTGEGVLHLHCIQIPGKKPMPVADVLNSRADWFAPGTSLAL